MIGLGSWLQRDVGVPIGIPPLGLRRFDDFPFRDDVRARNVRISQQRFNDPRFRIFYSDDSRAAHHIHISSVVPQLLQKIRPRQILFVADCNEPPSTKPLRPASGFALLIAIGMLSRSAASNRSVVERE